MRVSNVDVGCQTVAQYDDDVFQRRVGVILLGHAVDRGLAALGAVRIDVDDEDLFVSGNPVRCDTERFTLVFEFANFLLLFSFVSAVAKRYRQKKRRNLRVAK